MKTLFESRMNWKRRVIAVIRSITKGTKFTSDDIRAFAVRQRIEEPPQPNHWGQAVQAAKRFFLVRKTGEYRPTARRAGHQRAIAVWVRL